jgi:DNA modification methylase
MPKLQWHTETRKVSALIPNDKNPRVMSPKQIEDLKKSLKKFNLVEVPVINADNKVVAGHQRLMVLKLLGRENETIEVRVPSRKLTKSEYDQYLITSNALKGTWDWQKLAANFEMDTILVSGFDDADLSHLFDDLAVEDDEFDVEKELEKIKKPKSKLGDMYQLGPHRIICGSALDANTVKRLVGKAKIDMIYCDPIYNLGVNYDRGIGGKASYGGHTNDSKTDVEYRAFLKRSMENALAVAKPDVHAFYWCDQTYVGMVQGLFAELGLQNRRTCLWIKGTANPTPNVAFNKCYEPCIYATRQKPYLSPAVVNLCEVMNKELGPSGNKLLDDVIDGMDIWLAKRIAGQEYQHATQKPVTLHERPIKRCTKPGDAILDLFSGSASTLICADALKRVCYLSEIEPIFIDLAIKRYEQYAHIKARKLN